MRYASIDVLRTVAIFLMVVVHFMENLAGANWSAAGFGAPLFTFLAGVSYRLWLNGQASKGKGEAEISKASARRGLFLFALGFAFNVLVWLPEDTFNWDVLTLIGTALLVLNLARRVPLPVPAVTAGVLLGLAPVLRASAAYPTHWANGYFEHDQTLAGVLLGYLATGYFPLFPWLAYPLAGFVVATWVFADPAEPPPLAKAAALGAGLIGLSLLVRVARLAASDPVRAQLFGGWTMFPASTEYAFGTLGGAVLAFTLGHWLIDRRNPRLKERNALLRIAGTFSKYSLTVYLLHHVLHLWPLWVCGTFAGDEPTRFWREAMPARLAVPLAGVCIVCVYFFLRWMDRTGRRGVEAWMRDLCD
ncbi:MAG: heparan-alpha-glucosaminide N-acetyltransferase domain-containing protein [Gemmata sp.]